MGDLQIAGNAQMTSLKLHGANHSSIYDYCSPDGVMHAEYTPIIHVAIV